MNDGAQVGQCDVCRLVKQDGSQKWVRFCQLCRAWLCDGCRRQPFLRIKAALHRFRGY